MDGMESGQVVSRLEEFFSRSDVDLAAVYLFSSFARGTQTAGGDVASHIVSDERLGDLLEFGRQVREKLPA